jgi:hypothetical protein
MPHFGVELDGGLLFLRQYMVIMHAFITKAYLMSSLYASFDGYVLFHVLLNRFFKPAMLIRQDAKATPIVATVVSHAPQAVEMQMQGPSDVRLGVALAQKSGWL